MIFSGRGRRERECVDTFVFDRHIYWSDCSSIRSVLFEHIALAIRRFETDLTLTRPSAKSALSCHITFGN